MTDKPLESQLRDKYRLLTCECDFCTGKKRWSDNWCPRCAKVRMQPPKWWENLDVCDACEAEVAEELEIQDGPS